MSNTDNGPFLLGFVCSWEQTHTLTRTFRPEVVIYNKARHYSLLRVLFLPMDECFMSFSHSSFTHLRSALYLWYPPRMVTCEQGPCSVVACFSPAYLLSPPPRSQKALWRWPCECEERRVLCPCGKSTVGVLDHRVKFYSQKRHRARQLLHTGLKEAIFLQEAGELIRVTSGN